MTYTVYYKKPRGLFWHRIKGAVADAICEDRKKRSLPVRVITCEDKTRYELPMELYLIKYSKERWDIIKKNMEKEAGQSIPVRGD